jgi:hypothetical protein
MSISIPPDLIDLLRERRIIPFIGAGFSVGLGLPDWDFLLKEIASEVQGAPPYDQIHRMCQGDHLQIAEYFFLKYDKSIGPIRHRMAAKLNLTHAPIHSTAHVELVNLNSQQIYTTNYDEGIEQTFSKLGVAASVVALPKHIAAADRSKPQIVKYHGDLRYETTLVLTESSYYSRLEFESPMDLKFRSDLLGRSVLFIGYSFRDINIRIIWFKLMEMMKDVPEQDRPSSYVVRFEKNEVLEELYRAVGIKTIYLDPESKAKTTSEKTELLGEFMMELAMRVSDDGRMPGSRHQMFLSNGLIKQIQEQAASSRSQAYRSSAVRARERPALLIKQASARIIHLETAPAVDECLRVLSRTVYISDALSLAIKYFSLGYQGPGASFVVIRSLLRQGTRDQVLQSDPPVPWKVIWSTKLSQQELEMLMKTLESEVDARLEEGVIDYDIAYAADLVKRIASKTLVTTITPEIEAQAHELLSEAAKIYTAISTHLPIPDGPPDVTSITRQIDEATPVNEEATSDDDIPF